MNIFGHGDQKSTCHRKGKKLYICKLVFHTRYIGTVEQRTGVPRLKGCTTCAACADFSYNKTRRKSLALRHCKTLDEHIIMLIKKEEENMKERGRGREERGGREKITGPNVDSLGNTPDCWMNSPRYERYDSLKVHCIAAAQHSWEHSHKKKNIFLKKLLMCRR